MFFRDARLLKICRGFPSMPGSERRSSLRRVRHHDNRIILSPGHLRMTREAMTGVGGRLLLRLRVLLWLHGHLRLDLRLSWR